MQGNKTRRWVERLKSILIVTLILSALGFVGRVRRYTELPSAQNWLASIVHFFGDTVDATDAGTSGQTVLSTGLRPVRIAVSNQIGRCGIQYDANTVDEAFKTKLGGLLGEALVGAEASYPVSEDTWRAALGGETASVYYDFLGSVPLSDLSGWLGGEENNTLTGEARRILLAPGSGSTAVLYYSGGSDGLYYACATTVETESRLKSVTAEYTPNYAIFAFEQEKRYPNLEPYVMILPNTPTPLVYRAYNPIDKDNGTLDALLRALSFHPQTSSVYQSADGQVVREGTDTLRISDTGVVTYHASDSQDPRYPVASAGNTPDRGQMVETARALAENGLGPWCGDAGLYLMGTETLENGSVALYFGYLLDGAAVELYEDGYAGCFVFTDGFISDFTLYYRGYQKTVTYTAVLPEIQAVAAMNALQPAGNELILCYLDRGGTQVTASWVAK